jgi:hypothetical protein
MKHTAGTAAKAVGKTKSTITKAIASGRLSAIKNEKGAWEIDVSELHRVFPPSPSETVSFEQYDTPSRNTNDTNGLERLLEAAQAQIEDLKEDRDQWRKQAQTLALTDQSSPSRRRKLFGIF